MIRTHEGFWLATTGETRSPLHMKTATSSKGLKGHPGPILRSGMLFSLAVMSFLFVRSDTNAQAQSGSDDPVTLVVAGLSHGHSHWIFQDRFVADVDVIGIHEPNTALVERFKNSYNLDAGLFYDDLEFMLDELEPEGLLAFGSIYDHLAAVEAAAPRGIHVMVEKPLAVSMEHAERMETLAREHGIHLLTNYETSWYPSTERTYQLLNHSGERFGKLRKALFQHGHMGPQEIGVGPEFLEWLTDPKLNGGGALIDFGCYGANLMTYLTGGERPLTVTAVTQTHKPHIYPDVDDEATIIVTYPESQAIIQASWNWPIDRKDMEIYGESGYIIAPNPNTVRTGGQRGSQRSTESVDAIDVGIETNPFNYFADVIRGTIEVEPYSLYSLENNLLVVEILDAARRSAQTGRTIQLD